MEQFLGLKYKLKSSDNFDEYLNFIDVGLVNRKTAQAVSPITILTRSDDGIFTMDIQTTFKNAKMVFKLGEDFEEERLDGVKVKSVIVADGNKLIQSQIEDNGRKSTHIREFTPDTLTVTSTGEGWEGKCIRVYEIVK